MTQFDYNGQPIHLHLAAHADVAEVCPGQHASAQSDTGTLLDQVL